MVLVLIKLFSYNKRAMGNFVLHRALTRLTVAIVCSLFAGLLASFAFGVWQPSTAYALLFRRQATLKVVNNGDGVVLSLPAGIDCPDTCQVKVANRSSITLFADPDDDARFVQWGGDCSGTKPVCSVEVSGNTQVTARFALKSKQQGTPLSLENLRAAISLPTTNIACGNNTTDEPVFTYDGTRETQAQYITRYLNRKSNHWLWFRVVDKTGQPVEGVTVSAKAYPSIPADDPLLNPPNPFRSGQALDSPTGYQPCLNSSNQSIKSTAQGELIFNIRTPAKVVVAELLFQGPSLKPTAWRSSGCADDEISALYPSDSGVSSFASLIYGREAASFASCETSLYTSIDTITFTNAPAQGYKSAGLKVYPSFSRTYADYILDRSISYNQQPVKCTTGDLAGYSQKCRLDKKEAFWQTPVQLPLEKIQIVETMPPKRVGSVPAGFEWKQFAQKYLTVYSAEQNQGYKEYIIDCNIASPNSRRRITLDPVVLPANGQRDPSLPLFPLKPLTEDVSKRPQVFINYKESSHFLRVKFIDEEGKPIEGARIYARGWGDRGIYGDASESFKAGESLPADELAVSPVGYPTFDPQAEVEVGFYDLLIRGSNVFTKFKLCGGARTNDQGEAVVDVKSQPALTAIDLIAVKKVADKDENDKAILNRSEIQRVWGQDGNGRFQSTFPRQIWTFQRVNEEKKVLETLTRPYYSFSASFAEPAETTYKKDAQGKNLCARYFEDQIGGEEFPCYSFLDKIIKREPPWSEPIILQKTLANIKIEKPRLGEELSMIDDDGNGDRLYEVKWRFTGQESAVERFRISLSADTGKTYYFTKIYPKDYHTNQAFLDGYSESLRRYEGDYTGFLVLPLPGEPEQKNLDNDQASMLIKIEALDRLDQVIGVGQSNGFRLGNRLRVQIRLSIFPELDQGPLRVPGKLFFKSIDQSGRSYEISFTKFSEIEANLDDGRYAVELQLYSNQPARNGQPLYNPPLKIQRVDILGKGGFSASHAMTDTVTINREQRLTHFRISSEIHQNNCRSFQDVKICADNRAQTKNLLNDAGLADTFSKVADEIKRLRNIARLPRSPKEIVFADLGGVDAGYVSLEGGIRGLTTEGLPDSATDIYKNRSETIVVSSALLNSFKYTQQNLMTAIDHEFGHIVDDAKAPQDDGGGFRHESLSTALRIDTRWRDAYKILKDNQAEVVEQDSDGKVGNTDASNELESFAIVFNRLVNQRANFYDDWRTIVTNPTTSVGDSLINHQSIRDALTKPGVQAAVKTHHNIIAKEILGGYRQELAKLLQPFVTLVTFKFQKS